MLCLVIRTSIETLHRNDAFMMFECHHVIPLSYSLKGKSKLTELSLVCANCHRLIHGVYRKEKRWLSIGSGRAILSIIQPTAIKNTPYHYLRPQDLKALDARVKLGAIAHPLWSR